MSLSSGSSIRLWLLLALLGSDVIGSPVARDASRLRQPIDEPQHVLGAVSQTAATAAMAAPASRRLHGKFLHITDFHPDEFYKVHSSTAETSACHRGKGVAGTYGAETSDCDAPYSLINATFDWIAKHVRDDIDFVIWTGDSARHDSDERLPRSAAEVAGSNQFLADKFIGLLDDPKGRGLAVPVVPTLGNNDILPHNVLVPGPNKWLKQYAEIWERFIPEEQRHAFEFGGWFYVEVIPNQLAVFSLNTLYFFDRNAAVDDCVSPSEPGYKQLEWLRVQLQFMRERGVKAILMGHVPPARTGSKQLWDETCWQKYTLWLRQYRDVVVGSFYGHMNIDHFLVQDTDEINYDLLGAVDEDDEDDEGEGEDGGDGGGRAVEEAEQPVLVRTTMEDEMLTRSAVDYLQELRNGWSKLPNPAALGEVDADQKKKKKRKGRGPKLSRKWNERYQVTLVSPSMVPNYLPTLRIVKYNISGLEEVPVWTEGAGHVPVLPDDGKLYEEVAKKGKKGRKGRKDRDKDRKKDPNLTVPKGPAKTATIGPAYSVQPLSLLGYTQYYANLTQINNDIVAAARPRPADETVDASRWRKGKHSDKDPRTKPAKPHKFKFEVEYNTFKDKVYGLSDLTVGSFIETAYRMGGKAGGKAEKVDAEEVGQQSKKAQNKVWLRFLRHAFVTTVESDELEKLGT